MLKASRPPVRRTRADSRTTDSGSTTCSRTSLEITASKLPVVKQRPSPADLRRRSGLAPFKRRISEASSERPLNSSSPGSMPQIFQPRTLRDRKSTRLNSSHIKISYAVFCLKKKKKKKKKYKKKKQNKKKKQKNKKKKTK